MERFEVCQEKEDEYKKRYIVFLKEPIGVINSPNIFSTITEYFNVMLASTYGSSIVVNERFGGPKSGLWIIDKFDLVVNTFLLENLKTDELEKCCKTLKGTITNFIC